MGISNQSNAASQSYANKDVINQLPLDKAFKNSFKDVRAGGKKRKSRNNKASKKNKKVKKSMNKNSNNNSNGKNGRKSRIYGKKRKNQKAGSVNFVLRVGEDKIGGLARVDKFETQPVYKNGVPEVKQNDLGNRGSQGLCGGGKRKRKSSKKSNKKKSNNNNSGNNNSGNNNSGNNNKKKRRSKKKSRKMKGGNGENCFKMQQDALPSHYSENMTTRKFDCNQPNWDPKCT